MTELSTTDKRTPRTASSFLPRVISYSAGRLALLFFTVVASVYVTIIVANMNGFVDEIVRSQIQGAVAQIADALPRSLLLFGTSNLVLFGLTMIVVDR